MGEIFGKQNIRIAVCGRNLEDLLPLLKMFPVTIVEEEPDLVIAHGGDGSLLGAEKRYPGVPKCAIRDHRQNPKCPRHSELSTLQKLFAGTLRKTSLLKLEAHTEDGQILQGINDLVLTKITAQSAIRYRIWVDGELLCSQIVADSLVISTPFGSTGYFKSITRGHFLKGIGLAYNNTMDMNNFVVLPESSHVAVQLLRGPALLAADNDPHECRLETDHTLKINILDKTTDLYGADVFRCPDCFHLRENGF